jgi:hypothetical protein
MFQVSFDKFQFMINSIADCCLDEILPCNDNSRWKFCTVMEYVFLLLVVGISTASTYVNRTTYQFCQSLKNKKSCFYVSREKTKSVCMYYYFQP